MLENLARYSDGLHSPSQTFLHQPDILMGFMGSDTHAAPAFLPVAPWHRSSQTQLPFLQMQTGGAQDEHFQSGGDLAEGWCVDHERTCLKSVPPPHQQHKIYVKQ